MNGDSPLAALLDQLLTEELARLGLPAAAEQAARLALERELGPLRPGGPGEARLRTLPSGRMEAALRRAVEEGARVAGRTLPEHASRPDALVGRVLDGKYELEELLAEGGFGRVYRARDRDLDCAVAIKVLKPSGASSAELAAFTAEARRLTRLRHPNIVEWKTLNQTLDGRLYLVMEFLQGEVLEDALAREGRLAPARVARILLGVLDALRHAHRLPDGSSLLHLDLKPRNVFLVHDRPGEERVKVLDFGISRFVGQEPGPGAGAADADLGETTHARTLDARFAASTEPGVACTPLYCSPEQAARILGGASAPLDGRADLYSLGVMGYRLLTGELPFERADGLLGMLRLHRDVAPVPVGARGVRVPKRLARFVDRCLRKDPAERFADANAAHEALARVVEPGSTARLIAAGALTLLAGATLYLALRPTTPREPLGLVAAESGRALAGETLFFGPDRRARAFALAGLDAGVEVGRLRLVQGARAGSAELAGWSVRPSAEGGAAGRVEIAAEGAEASRALAVLALTDESGSTRLSEPFTLRYVDPGEWDVLEADVPGRAGRRLAPRGQALEVVVRGERELLPASVEVTLGAEAYRAARDEARSSDERSAYRLGLDGLPWTPGTNALGLRVVDAAGNVRASELALDVVTDDLGVASAALTSGAFSGGRWHVLAGEPVALRVESSRPARLTWSLVTTGGRVLGTGASAEAALVHEATLAPDLWGGAALAGTLRLELDEGERVAHAPDSAAGRARAELELEMRTSGAAFEAVLSGMRERVEEGLSAPVHYAATPELELTVLRDHDVPMQVRARCAPLADEQRAVTAEVAFSAPQEQRKTLRLALSEDGLARVALAGLRLDPDGHAFARPDLERELLVVRDTVAPAVELVEWDDALVLRSRAELAAFQPRLLVRDQTWTADPPPATVLWSLAVERVGGERTPAVTGEVAAPIGQPLALALALADGPEPDGLYVLTLLARDFAGNLTPQGASYRWSVSSEGPRLRVLLPASGESWTRFEEHFTVELWAEDANGVAAVECELSDARGELVALTIALAPGASATAGVGHWQGRFALDHRWSGRAVRLSFLGTDARGSPLREALVVPCVIAPIPNIVPTHVELAFHGRAAARMRRVAGNREAAYLLGGRGDSLENSSFRAHGLSDFSGRALASSLRIEIPAGAIPDFYLDEYEVAVGALLSFVRAADGYADGSLWSEGAPDETRRAELEAALATLAPELPATGVTLAEARAYAHWVGKELPTLLHWEYAVRGLAGRPFSFADGDAPPVLGQDVNVAGTEPWPVARGLDRTQDTGLFDLCSNVAEWTTTPADERLGDMGPSELLALRGTSGARVFAAGGSFARSAYHFAVVERRRADQGSPAVGFRCFLPAARVEAAFLETGGEYAVAPVRP